MSKRESGFWAEIKRAIGGRNGHDLRRIENSCETGTPDVEYCIDGQCGWIELKHIPTLPARDTTILRVDHFTGAQRAWALVRATCGGRTWVLLRAGDETFLFRGGHAARYLGLKWTLEECRQRAAYHCEGRPDWDALVMELVS
jgi:hypothetical protein